MENEIFSVNYNHLPRYGHLVYIIIYPGMVILIYIIIYPGMVILTSGADDPDGSGLAVWVQNMRLYVRVSTLTKEWTLTTKSFPSDEFFKILISWSKQTGNVTSLFQTLIREQPFDDLTQLL